MKKLILISGENNSGKSRFAESLVAKCTGKRYYIATMIPKMEENHRKIEKHKIQRAGLGFTTLELAYDLAEFSPETDSVVLLEDVSNLLANCIFEKGRNKDEVFEDIISLSQRCKVLIAVTISGIDVAGYDGETMMYIESINALNRKLYDEAAVAVSMVNGNPVYEKGKENDIF